MLLVFEPYSVKQYAYEVGCGCENATKVIVDSRKTAEILSEDFANNHLTVEGCTNFFCDFFDLEIREIDKLEGIEFVSIPELFGSHILKAFRKKTGDSSDLDWNEKKFSSRDLLDFLMPLKVKESLGKTMNLELKKYFDKLFDFVLECRDRDVDVKVIKVNE